MRSCANILWIRTWKIAGENSCCRFGWSAACNLNINTNFLTAAATGAVAAEPDFITVNADEINITTTLLVNGPYGPPHT